MAKLASHLRLRCCDRLTDSLLLFFGILRSGVAEICVLVLISGGSCDSALLSTLLAEELDFRSTRKTKRCGIGFERKFFDLEDSFVLLQIHRSQIRYESLDVHQP